MNFRLHLPLVVIAVIVMAACVPTTSPPVITPSEVHEEAAIQQKIVNQAELELQLKIQSDHAKTSLRANTIHRRLLRANIEYCQNQTTDIGALIANRNTFAPSLFDNSIPYNPNWNNMYPTDENMRVLEVQPGTPASRAGLEVNDIVIGVDDTSLGSGGRGSTNFKRAMRTAGVKTLTVNRDGKYFQIPVKTEYICIMPLVILNTNELNAYADGEAIYLNAGMERALRDDTQLAILLGHEMAHNTLRHMESKAVGMLIGGLIGASIDPAYTDVGQQMGSIVYSQEFETEADYVGVYFASRAGYDVSQAAELWRAMGLINPDSIHVPSLTHPSTALRYNTIKKTSEEIARKQMLGQPLHYESKR